MARYIDALFAIHERAPEASTFSVGAASRPLCADEKGERKLQKPAGAPIDHALVPLEHESEPIAEHRGAREVRRFCARH